MSEVDQELGFEAKPPMWLVGTAVGGVVLSLGALAWSLGLQNHLEDTQKKLDAANKQTTALVDQLEDTNERLKAQGEALGQSVGLTQKQLEDRSNELVATQKAALAETAKLKQAEAKTEQEVGSVKSDVNGVKTDVGGVKTDVASTQADLAATKTQLTRVMGDAGVMSGLIATNHDELEQLKHKGDRNYYEFTLQKGAPAQVVGTIKVQLKKVDQKKSKYTLAVSSDDKNIEKKDKNLDEPVQFYSGKTPALFELVVNNINKNQVTGYLSTPKSVAGPMQVP